MTTTAPLSSSPQFEPGLTRGSRDKYTSRNKRRVLTLIGTIAATTAGVLIFAKPQNPSEGVATRDKTEQTADTAPIINPEYAIPAPKDLVVPNAEELTRLINQLMDNLSACYAATPPSNCLDYYVGGEGSYNDSLRDSIASVNTERNSDPTYQGVAYKVNDGDIRSDVMTSDGRVITVQVMGNYNGVIQIEQQELTLNERSLIVPSGPNIGNEEIGWLVTNKRIL